MTLAITSTCVGGRHVSREGAMPPKQYYSRRPIENRSVAMTPAELNACKAIIEAGDYKNAAWKLGLSKKTIECHVQSAKEKLGFKHSLHLLIHVSKMYQNSPAAGQ